MEKCHIFRTVKKIERTGSLDILKSFVHEHVLKVPTHIGMTPARADQFRECLPSRLIHRALWPHERRIGNHLPTRQYATRLQHALNLVQRALGVRDMHQDRVRVDSVEGIILERESSRIANVERRVVVPTSSRGCASYHDLRLLHVNPMQLPRFNRPCQTD